jgi:hypothetical protein
MKKLFKALGLAFLASLFVIGGGTNSIAADPSVLVDTHKIVFEDGTCMNLPADLPKEVMEWDMIAPPMMYTEFVGFFAVQSVDSEAGAFFYFSLIVEDHLLGIGYIRKDSKKYWLTSNPLFGSETYYEVDGDTFLYMIDGYKGPPEKL